MNEVFIPIVHLKGLSSGNYMIYLFLPCDCWLWSYDVMKKHRKRQKHQNDATIWTMTFCMTTGCYVSIFLIFDLTKDFKVSN